MNGEYRIFFGAFPEGELAEQIQAVRERYDAKTARITAPHVTLAGTYWRAGPGTPENEMDVIGRFQALSQLRAFTLLLGGIRTFGNRIVYLGVAETPELLAARRELLTLIGPDKHRGRFTPHLTLAMRLDRSETERMVGELRETVWESGRFVAPIDRLHLMQRGAHDPAWQRIATLTLPQAGGASPLR